MSRTRARRPAPNALGVTPASGYSHYASRMPPCFHGARAHTDLPGFRPLRRSQMAASTIMPAAAFAVAARVCLTRYVPSSGLRTLLTVFSATTPAGLFHPARALGVPPFRAYSRRAGTPLGALCPPDVSVTDPARRRALPTYCSEPWPEYSGFDTHAAGGRPPSPSGLCSLRRSRTSPRWFRPRRARKLSWVYSSSGVYRPRRTRRFTPGNFLGLRANTFRTGARLTSTTGSTKHTTTAAGAISLETCRPS